MAIQNAFRLGLIVNIKASYQIDSCVSYHLVCYLSPIIFLSKKLQILSYVLTKEPHNIEKQDSRECQNVIRIEKIH